MISLSRSVRSAAYGTAALVAVAAVAGCGASSPGSSGSGSSSGGSHSTSFRQCLEKHGVTPPSGGRPSGSSGAPHPRPTGSAATAFRKAIQDCGGSGGGFGGGGFGG
jgi:hypothetical protein